MKKDTIIFTILGLLTGVIMAGFVAGRAVNSNNTAMMQMMGMRSSDSQSAIRDHDSMSMADMTKQLSNKYGDDFDKSFLELMISHHEGAVAMAELIPSRTKHTEIKQLGEAIIIAQSKEITDMRKWQRDWGYSTSEMMNPMHGNH